MFDSVYQFMQYMPERFEIASRSSGAWRLGLGLGHVFGTLYHFVFAITDRVVAII